VHDDSTGRGHRGVLYLVVSGAPAPEGVPALVGQCQAAGWRVVVFSTPIGVRFRQRYPDVRIGMISSRAWQACIPAADDGETVITRRELRDLLDRVCELLGGDE